MHAWVITAPTRCAEIDIEITIVIPAGEAGISVGQWHGMIRRLSSDDHLRW